MELYLGVDAGSVRTKLVVLNKSLRLLHFVDTPTGGDPASAIRFGMERLKSQMRNVHCFTAKAVTGSARELAADIIRADVVKNEITCQGVFATRFLPGVKSVIEIGGQDSKYILLEDDLVSDFAMNSICAAGTGSFLDHQAARFGISITEFSAMALTSRHPAEISGRCTVFVESDIIHRQQCGEGLPDLIYGLCRVLCRNYLNDVVGSKPLEMPVLFQGGVAKNAGLARAFKEVLQFSPIVPPQPEFTGATGAAYLAAGVTMPHNKV